jgi:hypothetical protein
MLPARTVAVVPVILATALAGCGSASPTRARQPSPAATTQAVSVLFSQSATGGTLEPAGKNRRVLTLTGVGHLTIWFQDRPGRDAGQQSTSAFVRSWAQLGFAADSPNAALTLLDGADDADTLIVDLVGRPRYNAKRDTISYTVRVLDSAPSGLRTFHPDRAIPRRFDDASLFIDGGNAPQPTYYGNTFAYDTAVRLPDGSSKPIETLNLGDTVMSVGADGGPTPARVTFSVGMDNTRLPLVFLHIGDRQLLATPDTTFPNGVRADDLMPGDRLPAVDGQTQVTSLGIGFFLGGIHRIAIDGPTGLFYANGLLVHDFGR